MYPKRSALRVWIKADGLWALLLLAAGVGLGAIAVTGRTTAQALAADGVTATATVTDLDRIPRREKEDHYKVSYTFDLPDGGSVSALQDVDAGFFRDLAVGQSLPVRYMPDDPQVSEVQIGAAGRKGWITMLIAAVVIAAGATMTWFGMQRARVVVALRDKGDMRNAEVVEHKLFEREKGPPLNGVAIWRDSTGARGETMTRKVADLPQVGTVLTVYADPADAVPAAWEGDVGTR